jgi:hypothetical protein
LSSGTCQEEAAASPQIFAEYSERDGKHRHKGWPYGTRKEQLKTEVFNKKKRILMRALKILVEKTNAPLSSLRPWTGSGS